MARTRPSLLFVWPFLLYFLHPPIRDYFTLVASRALFEFGSGGCGPLQRLKLLYRGVRTHARTHQATIQQTSNTQAKTSKSWLFHTGRSKKVLACLHWQTATRNNKIRDRLASTKSGEAARVHRRLPINTNPFLWLRRKRSKIRLPNGKFGILYFPDHKSREIAVSLTKDPRRKSDYQRRDACQELHFQRTVTRECFRKIEAKRVTVDLAVPMGCYHQVLREEYSSFFAFKL